MEKINRAALVRRHNPRQVGWNPLSPLSVGNGNFAFTADFTGLQTYRSPKGEAVPCCTMSQWGFHSYPDAATQDSLRLHYYQAGEKTVGYMTDPTGQEALFESLRINPHRFNLGRIGLYHPNPADPEHATQELDLYTARLESNFLQDGEPVHVTTACHPAIDMVAVRLESSLLATGDLGLELEFPYPSHEISGSDWQKEEAHRSVLVQESASVFRIERTVDDTTYTVCVRFGDNVPVSIKREGTHRWVVLTDSSYLEASIAFFQGSPAESVPTFEETVAEAGLWWKTFWEKGAAISFEGSTDSRAEELERRVILSQYVTAIQCFGSYPPQETGLTCNSWFGKFHLEMHPWHAAHAILWNREELVERSLGWYAKILPVARERAAQQGYNGARWPKMTDPAGYDSPSSIGTLLCWQQPHPIYFAELLYRRHPSHEILERYGLLVSETVDFMVDYLQWDESGHRYLIGPPVIPVQENHDPTKTVNPMFEIEYWRWALHVAETWKSRMGQPIPKRWDEVLSHLSQSPRDDKNRRYIAHEGCFDTYGDFAADHPSLLYAYGFLPATGLDPDYLYNSYAAVMDSWDFSSAWGWDFPAIAMTLARLGRREEAVDILLSDYPKNCCLPNGHNRQNSVLPLYLPGNGSLLLAVAMMAGGWDGCKAHAPGFPDNGKWNVTVEQMGRYL